MIALQRHSLSRRLLLSLLVVTFGCWSVMAWLTVQDSVNEIDELFDAHLAQTALALLRVTDPDENDPVAIPNRTEDPALSEIFRQWRELSERLGEFRNTPNAQKFSKTPTAPALTGSTNALHAAYEKNLRYQVWSGQGTLILNSANAPPVPMATGTAIRRAPIGMAGSGVTLASGISITTSAFWSLKPMICAANW